MHEMTDYITGKVRKSRRTACTEKTKLIEIFKIIFNVFLFFSMEYVLGSFYTKDVLPQFCFTIYSKWGNPNKERELISKGASKYAKIFSQHFVKL